MSAGPVLAPFFNTVCWYLERCAFWHLTSYYILPPGLDVTVQWAPEEPDKVILIFALSFGKPRNYLTGEVFYTDRAGFWHRGRGMKWHWDPLVESITGVVYPHITPATQREPFEIRFVNYTDVPIVIDVSVWMFEYHERDFEDFVEMVGGFSRLLRLLNRVMDRLGEERAAELIESLLRR